MRAPFPACTPQTPANARTPRARRFKRIVEDLQCGGAAWEVWKLLEGRDGAVAPEDILKLAEDPDNPVPLPGGHLI